MRLTCDQPTTLMKMNHALIISTTMACLSLGTAIEVRAQEAVVRTTTTRNIGTVTEFGPEGMVIHSDTATAPLRYGFTKTTTYVDEDGRPVSIEQVRAGTPVTVEYAREGDRLIANRVIVRKTVTPEGTVIEKKTVVPGDTVVEKKRTILPPGTVMRDGRPVIPDGVVVEKREPAVVPEGTVIEKKVVPVVPAGRVIEKKVVPVVPEGQVIEKKVLPDGTIIEKKTTTTTTTERR